MQTFQTMLTEVASYQIPKSSTEEDDLYLQALVDSAVFTDDMVTSEMAAQADTDARALELAVSAEKDSILFYYGMREIMPRQLQTTVDNIITEEKSHLRQLTDLRRKTAAP